MVAMFLLCISPLQVVSRALGQTQSEHRSDVYGYTQIKAKCQSKEGSMLKGKY